MIHPVMVRLSLVAFVAALSASQASASPAASTSLLQDAAAHFRRFIADYGRKYADAEEMHKRFQIFKDNLRKIDALNAESKHAVFGITYLADLTDEEISTYHHRRGLLMPVLRDDDTCSVIKAKDIVVKDVPDEWDWRKQNAVTEVKNQGDCGSCWAFSTMGNLEGQYAIKNKQLLDFSVQQLVDCDEYDARCAGGIQVTAFTYLKETGGAMSEQDYPYEDRNATCRFDKSKVKVVVKDCNKYDTTNEDELKKILYSQGPLSVAIDAKSLLRYNKGILDTCKYEQLNHAVLLVGYGIENGIPYWTLKNSWSRRFGEDGYFRIERGSNQCGMMNYPMSSAVL